MCVFEFYSNIRLAHVYNCNPLYHNVFEMNKYPNVGMYDPFDHFHSVWYGWYFLSCCTLPTSSLSLLPFDVVSSFYILFFCCFCCCKPYMFVSLLLFIIISLLSHRAPFYYYYYYYSISSLICTNIFILYLYSTYMDLHLFSNWFCYCYFLI